MNQVKIKKYYAEAKKLGIDEVYRWLEEHKKEVGHNFYFLEATEEDCFIEYAAVKIIIEEGF